MRVVPGDASGLQVIVPYGPSGSSARVRAFDWLEHTGIRGTVHQYLGLGINSPSLVLRRPLKAFAAEVELWSLARRATRDTVFLVREASPFSRGHVESAILTRAQRAVYDFDDALMVQASGVVEKTFSKAEKWRRCVSSADVVVAGNDMLAELAASEGALSVVVIPSCVEPKDYATKKDFERTGPPTAVWLGSPSTEKYLVDIARPLLDVHRRYGLRLEVISAGHRSLGPLDKMVTRVAWTPAVSSVLAKYDFGLMPLTDNLWTRGKCAYKLLQYGAAGLPMIGSPVGANQMALHSMSGLKAATEDEWREGLGMLATADPSSLAALGAAGRSGVERDYSFEAWAPTWLTAVGLTRD